MGVERSQLGDYGVIGLIELIEVLHRGPASVIRIVALINAVINALIAIKRLHVGLEVLLSVV